MGKATTVGQHTIRIDVSVDVEGIREGEVRTTVMPVDRYLAARGHLAVYSQFSPKTSGVYKLAIDIDGRELGTNKIDVICPGISLSLPLSPADFRDIQKRIQEYERDEKANTTGGKKAASKLGVQEVLARMANLAMNLEWPSAA